MTKASKASNVAPSDQARLTNQEAPRCRANWGKRRRATSSVRAGVASRDTSNKDSTTMRGVTAKITISGASTVLSPPAPTLCNQAQTALTKLEASNQARTAASAPSQKK